MPTFTAEEARERLDDLIDLAMRGEKVFIRRGDETFELAAFVDTDRVAAERERVMALMRAGSERANSKTE